MKKAKPLTHEVPAEEPAEPAPVEEWRKRQEQFATHLFLYNTTLAARVALGHGIPAGAISQYLTDLAYAIETGDVAESMGAVPDGSTLEQLIN
jgi:hypothetical protein